MQADWPRRKLSVLSAGALHLVVPTDTIWVTRSHVQEQPSPCKDPYNDEQWLEELFTQLLLVYLQ